MTTQDKLISIFGPRVLVVAAHPDDEALGCGGLIAELSSRGVEVSVLFFADGESSRLRGKSVEVNIERITERKAASGIAGETLGYRPSIFLGMEDNQLDRYPILELAQHVEATIDKVCPSFIVTHSHSDLNVDHRASLEACLIASRPSPGREVRGLASFEVPSSTGWGFASRETFRPNLFVNIEESLQKKLKALEAYGAEIPSPPHARSLEAVAAMAAFRGSHIGVHAAEAFELHRILL